jgi:CRISPR-associated protein Cas2
MKGSHVHVFAYDISNNRRRYRVSKLLEAKGIRVQESVFEIRGDHQAIENLAARAKRQMMPGDSLRVYPIPSAVLPWCIAHGGAPIPEPSDYHLF